MSKLRIFSLLMVVVMLFMSTSAVLAQEPLPPTGNKSVAPREVAPTGLNGQQIRFVTQFGSFSSLKIVGNNQNNTQVTFNKSFSPSVSDYKISGLWWKGWVQITVKITGTSNANGEYTCWIEIPKTNLLSNWVTVKFNPAYGTCTR